MKRKRALRRSGGQKALGVSVVLFLLTACPPDVAAQCPDGTPPPCVTRVVRAAAPRPPAEALRRRSFLVLPFRNISRAAEHEWLVEGSPVMLAEALSRHEALTVVPDERLYPALQRAGLQPGAVMDLARVRRVAAETGGWTAVAGEVIAVGDRVRVSARAFDVVTNREVTRAQEEVRASEDIRVAYERLATGLLRVAGVDTGTVQLAATTTGSLDAYRAYLRGVAHMSRSEVRQAREAFLEAVHLDSTFARAYARLAEASMNVRPEDLADAQSPSYRYAARAAALSSRLPPRDRGLVEAINYLFLGRFGDTRRALESLLAADSSDIDALEWMANLEAFDPILVPGRGGSRPRGSMNAAMRLAKRVLELDPSKHQMYQNLVIGHAVAGGYGVGLAMGYEREAASLAAMLNTQPSRVFFPLFRDSIELLPIDSASLPPDTLTASRRRALAVARSWAERWLAVAPGEAEAHLWASRIYELSDEHAAALRELERADSLGVETGIESVPVRRLALLLQLDRQSEASRIADSLWTAGTITFTPISGRAIEAAGWIFLLSLANGQVERAGTLIERLAAVLPPTPDILRLTPEGTAATVLSGGIPRGAGGVFSAPPELRARVFEVFLARIATTPPSGAIARYLPWLVRVSRGDQNPATRARLAARGADAALVLAEGGREELAYELGVAAASADSTQRARLATVPWYAGRTEASREHRLRVQRRFRPVRALVTDAEAVFEWTVSGGDSVAWNQPGTLFIEPEYIWTVDAEVAGARYEALLERRRPPGAAPRSGPLGELLNASGRLVHLVPGDTSLPHRNVPGARLAVEPTPAGFRMTLRDTTIVAALRRERPATVRFRFRPCEPDPATPCVDERVTVAYP